MLSETASRATEFRKGMPKLRFFGNALLTLLTKIASGYWQLDGSPEWLHGDFTESA